MDDAGGADGQVSGSLSGVLVAVRDAVLGLQGDDLQSLDSALLLAQTAALRALLDQGEGEFLRRVGEVHVRGAADAVGAGSTAAFLRGTVLMSPVEASRVVRAASVLRSTCTATADALAAGQIGVAQAQVVAKVIAALPAALAGEVRLRGEGVLLEHAAVLNPADLARAARFFAAQVDPEGVARDEREAVERSGITFAATWDGAGIARGDLDAESLALIQGALEPLSAPCPDPDGGFDRRTASRRRLDALKLIVRHYLACQTEPGVRRPGTGLTVVTSVEALAGVPGAGGSGLDWGGVISSEATRRLACDSLVTVVTTGALGQVLDVGRRTKVVSARLWTALVVRDEGCAFPGCDAPPSRCDAHHIKHWVHGGCTALGNLVLLCERHHHRVLHDLEHVDRWMVHIDHDTGRPVFTPPAWTGRAGVPLPPLTPMPPLWRPPPED